MSKEILLKTKGKILKGDDQGSYIEIEKNDDDSYLIFLSKEKSFDKEVFDDWVENEASLKDYFLESNWDIEWEK